MPFTSGTCTLGMLAAVERLIVQVTCMCGTRSRMLFTSGTANAGVRALSPKCREVYEHSRRSGMPFALCTCQIGDARSRGTQVWQLISGRGLQCRQKQGGAHFSSSANARAPESP